MGNQKEQIGAKLIQIGPNLANPELVGRIEREGRAELETGDANRQGLKWTLVLKGTQAYQELVNADRPVVRVETLPDGREVIFFL